MSTLLDTLLDENNKEPICLKTNDSDNIYCFEQIAIIDHKVHGQQKIFAVLKPIACLDQVADDEAVVFRYDENSDSLFIETDKKIAEIVFGKYYDLLEKEWEDNK